MKRILICTGVLGGGTALVFAAAALAATLAPAGTIVPSNGQQVQMLRGWANSGVNVIAPDGGGNFGVLSGSNGPAVNIAVDLPANAPEPGVVEPEIAPLGTEAP